MPPCSSWGQEPPSDFECSPIMQAPDRINDPAYWRQRADEARHMAGQLTDPAARQAIEDVAASYERLAQIAEQKPLKQV